VSLSADVPFDAKLLAGSPPKMTLKAIYVNSTYSQTANGHSNGSISVVQSATTVHVNATGPRARAARALRGHMLTHITHSQGEYIHRHLLASGAGSSDGEACAMYLGSVGGHWPTPQRGHWFPNEGAQRSLQPTHLLCGYICIYVYMNTDISSQHLNVYIIHLALVGDISSLREKIGLLCRSTSNTEPDGGIPAKREMYKIVIYQRDTSR